MTRSPFTKVALMFALGCAALAQVPVSEEQETTRFSAEQLDQIAAPIALYPDALLTQVLIAATYPLEVVEADRFMRANPGLTAEALERQLASRDWDPSVKFLTAFPDLLTRMSENLDWTRDLGDAFLGQKEELMDAVQRLRGRAYDAGNLKTTSEQVVTVRDDRIIEIVPATTEVIYVPVYSPTVVYGRWSYPHYYYPSFYGFLGTRYGFLSFGYPYRWRWPFWSRPYWGWGSSDIFIDINIFNRFGNTVVGGGFQTLQATTSDGIARWQHRPEHRRGVNYRDPAVAKRFTGRDSPGFFTREERRGFERTRPAPSIPGKEPAAPAPNGDRAAPNGNRARPAPPTGVEPKAPAPDRRRIEPARPAPERPRTEPPRPPTPRTEPPRAQPPRVQPPKAEPPRAQPRTPAPVQRAPQRATPAPRGGDRRPNAWSGSRNPSLDSAARNRGSRSRATAPAAPRRGQRPDPEKQDPRNPRRPGN
jgi:hypothetical protein